MDSQEVVQIPESEIIESFQYSGQSNSGGRDYNQDAFLTSESIFLPAKHRSGKTDEQEASVNIDQEQAQHLSELIEGSVLNSFQKYSQFDGIN